MDEKEQKIRDKHKEIFSSMTPFEINPIQPSWIHIEYLLAVIDELRRYNNCKMRKEVNHE